MKKIVLGTLTVAAVALALGACGSAPTTNNNPVDTSAATTPAGASTTAPVATTAPTATSSAIPGAANFTACVVSDTGGFQDKSFNESAYNGLVQAQQQIGIQVKSAQSQSAADYAPNINQMIQANCDIIFGVGFNLEQAMVSAAQANPTKHFAIIDDSPQNAPSNLQPIVFNTDEAAFLAGYAAAAYSTAGKVATWGGMQIPTVTIYMDGFAQGVAQYNTDNNANVTVLGWDATTQKGSFTNDFNDQTKGQNLTKQLIAQGADVIFPVAGNAGLGAFQPAQQAKAVVIWVDQDGFVSVPQYQDTILTSATKGIQSAVFNTIKDTLTGSFSAAPYIGTLANGGVTLAPFHNFESKVPSGLQDKLTQLQQQIISGQIKMTSKAEF
ncbi:MAG: BMP family ABC transporter substrate-binding protein [Micrococcales bacterium]|nr:BMP family ABC transporter substrate-binding protein [Micrococcales bacterium]